MFWFWKCDALIRLRGLKQCFYYGGNYKEAVLCWLRHSRGPVCEILCGCLVFCGSLIIRGVFLCNQKKHRSVNTNVLNKGKIPYIWCANETKMEKHVVHYCGASICPECECGKWIAPGTDRYKCEHKRNRITWNFGVPSQIWTKKTMSDAAFTFTFIFADCISGILCL